MEEIDFADVMKKLTSRVTEGEGEDVTQRDLTYGEVVNLSTDVNNHVNKLNATINTQDETIANLQLQNQKANETIGKLLTQTGVAKEDVSRETKTETGENETPEFNWL